jgi:hypothetical protein
MVGLKVRKTDFQNLQRVSSQGEGIFSPHITVNQCLKSPQKNQKM